ncbi:MAG TPA: gamma-glutamyltransferase [Mycobacteriales bacterium]|nr:gamma-glutamyltransferase [Mycobacteriales bacterium]
MTAQTVYSKQGMVVAGQPLASAAGARVLADGGNAVDAALAVAGATAVTMPEMCGLGGDAFALVYDAATGTVTAYNGSGPAPATATPEAFAERGFTELMPFDGWLSVATPGAVSVYAGLHRDHASRPLPELWADAIRLADEGYPMDARCAKYLAMDAKRLAADPAAARIFLPNGEPPTAGTVHRNQDLAASLAAVAADPTTMWTGDIARAVAAASHAGAGLLELGDLPMEPASAYEPLSTDYRGHRVHTTAPPSQGLILLEILNLLEGFDLAALAPDSAQLVHLVVEATRLAFADRNRWCGDPAFVADVTAELVSKSYAGRRRDALDPRRAAAQVSGGDLDGNTTSFVVADAAGNAVSFIHSLSAAWGAGVVAAGTGILMNNRAGRGFSLRPGHPNLVAPRKRTMHTLLTYLVTDAASGELELVGNTPGGDGQPQWNAQILIHLLDHARDVGAAVSAPRWTATPGTDPISLSQPQRLAIEQAVGGDTVADLQQRGHSVLAIPTAGGSATVIRRRGDGVLEGGADPRDTAQVIGI